MALTALSPQLARALGGYTELVIGIAGGSGTSTVVTVPQFTVCLGAIAGGATSSTSPYCDTVSGNTFTVTHGNNDVFTYVAFGQARI